MNAKFFLDTNIFVYSFDGREPLKQRKAQNLIDKALTSAGDEKLLSEVRVEVRQLTSHYPLPG